jgi:hypothetical protein
MIEIWLTFNNGEEKLRLPVIPPEYTVTTALENQRVNVVELGEILLIGRRTLKEITLESYFPLRYDDNCQYNRFPAPAKCVEMIEKWRDSGRPLRLMIVAKGLSYNEAMAVESFEYGAKHGPEDVYYTLALAEYRFTKKKIVGPDGPVEERPAEKDPSGIYVTQIGDTLPRVAKRLYGDGHKYTALMQKNGLTDNDLILLRVGLELEY